MAVSNAISKAQSIVRHKTRVVVLLRDDLLPWQELNITAFLISGIANSTDDMTGDRYFDADGNEYLPMLRQPVLVFSASSEQLKNARAKAHSRGMAMSIYTYELFSTGDDESNRAAVATVRADDLDLVGIAIHGPKNAVDRITKSIPRHE